MIVGRDGLSEVPEKAGCEGAPWFGGMWAGPYRFRQSLLVAGDRDPQQYASVLVEGHGLQLPKGPFRWMVLDLSASPTVRADQPQVPGVRADPLEVHSL
jgi:hypothetical protein